MIPGITETNDVSKVRIFFMHAYRNYIGLITIDVDIFQWNSHFFVYLPGIPPELTQKFVLTDRIKFLPAAAMPEL